MNLQRMDLKKLAATAAVAVSFTFGAGGAYAQEHPHYVHALSDLRMARALLSHEAEGSVMHAQAVAIEEIDHAIGEIRRASIDDGRDPDFRPPIDEHLDRRGRLGKARELVEEAREDLGRREGNLAAMEWREAAIHHVEEAHHSIERAIQDKRRDEDR